MSKGKWIAFLDSDDVWFNNKLGIIYKNIKENKKYEVFCNNEIIYLNNIKKKYWKYGPYSNQFYKDLLEKGNCISTSASVVSRNFLKSKNINFNENKSFITAEDYDFFLRNVFFNIKRRRWLNLETNKVVHRNWDLVAQGTRITKDFASFLKEIGRYTSS
jgi:glycosyltransferase involved in cell wall biosynthesis